MKVASYTQTYGNQRLLELILLKYDTLGNHFRNKCDIIIFSFHNCSKNIIKMGIEILKKIYPEQKLQILIYNNISYLNSIQNSIKFLKSVNIDYILQIQDDQFGINSKENLKNIQIIDDVFNFLIEHKPQYFNIFGNKSFRDLPPLQIIKKDNINFYSFDSRDFKKINAYSWNDGTYFVNLSFLDMLFNLNISNDDVWNIENTFNALFLNKKYIRWGTDKYFFKAINIHGPNRNKKKSPIENVSDCFCDTEQWSNVIDDINKYITIII